MATTTASAQELVLDFIATSQARGFSGRMRHQIYTHLQAQGRDRAEAQTTVNGLLDKGTLETFAWKRKATISPFADPHRAVYTQTRDTATTEPRNAS